MQTHTAFTTDQKDVLLYFSVFPPLPLSVSYSLSVVLQESVSSDWQFLSLCSLNTDTVSHTKSKIRHSSRQAVCKASVI